MDYKSPLARQEVFVSGANWWWWDGPVIAREEHWTDWLPTYLPNNHISLNREPIASQSMQVCELGKQFVSEFSAVVFDICKYFLANFPHPSRVPMQKTTCRQSWELQPWLKQNKPLRLWWATFPERALLICHSLPVHPLLTRVVANMSL